MMKGFVKKGLLLLALGVLIAGCAGPAEEDAISSSKDGNINGVPMVLDPANHKLTIGDGSGGALFNDNVVAGIAYGHTIELINGSTNASGCTDDGTGNSKCWIRMYNRDPDEYMANAFVLFTACASCNLTNHTMDNFDAENLSTPACWNDVTGSPIVAPGCTVHLPATNAYGNMSGPTPIMPAPATGGAIAYVSDYFFPEISVAPANPFGAPMHVLQAIPTPVKADWMVAPVCGYGVQEWDFGGTDLTLFPFWATVKAGWWKMNPFGTGSNGVVGGGDDDTRFDFQNFDTWYVVATDLVALATDTAYQKLYRPGSIYRSNVLAGYRPAWAKAAASYDVPGKSTFDLPYASQKYFAVNVGFDAANRIESQPMGLKTNLVYEYYQQVTTLVSWNNKIVQHNAAGTNWFITKLATLGGTRFQQTATSLCVTQAGCDDNFGSSSGVEVRFDLSSVAVAATPSTANAGYIGVIARNPSLGNWSYFGTYESYIYAPFDGTWATTTIGPIDPGNQRNIPKYFGIRGFTKIRCMTDNNATCITQDGADSDPEYWLFQFVLKAQAGRIGLGSEIKLETHSQYTATIYRKTLPGIDAFDSQDPHPTDNTTNGGPMRDTVTYDTIIGGNTISVKGNNGSVAFGNAKIRHRGPTKSSSHQGWNINVCIR